MVEPRRRETINTRHRSPMHLYIVCMTIRERGVEETESRILRLPLLAESLRHHLKPRSLTPRVPGLELGIGDDLSLVSVQASERIEL